VWCIECFLSVATRAVGGTSRPETPSLPLAARGGPASTQAPGRRSGLSGTEAFQLDRELGVCPRTGPPGNAGVSGLTNVALAGERAPAAGPGQVLEFEARDGTLVARKARAARDPVDAVYGILSHLHIDVDKELEQPWLRAELFSGASNARPDDLSSPETSGAGSFSPQRKGGFVPPEGGRPYEDVRRGGRDKT
jgi:hypothetical protein